MYIKSVVIDGFKTYGNRVEAPNFDPQFTAITGPNGSGKSNFLDAITFVLGMQSARLVIKNLLLCFFFLFYLLFARF